MKPHEKLLAATGAGNLNAALALLQKQPIMTARKLLRRAGFFVNNPENKKEFWEDVKSDLAEACQKRAGRQVQSKTN
ncbi:MAG: hypothetical protein Q7T74_06885 [Candidatus Saccharibacteria bacterium]|nr:hypothetical protein [Candidatus Saccharibacteria bacterium]